MRGVIRMNNELKDKLDSAFARMDVVTINNMLTEYGERYPKDRDLWFYRYNLLFIQGQYDEAAEIAKMCVEHFPTSYEAYYYLGASYQHEGNVMEALRCYETAMYLHIFFKYDNNDIYEDIIVQIRELQQKLSDIQQRYVNDNNVEKLNEIMLFLNGEKTIWEKEDDAIRDRKRIVIGTKNKYGNDIKYIGTYKLLNHRIVGEEVYNLIQTQGEFLNIIYEGKEFSLNGGEEYLLPIASSEEGNMYYFKEKGKEYYVPQIEPKHFNYYRLNGDIEFVSKNNIYLSNPIPLKHSKSRRKLVLSFFVDGLAQEIIKGSEFERLMPNTYKFFKKGTICTNTYSCAEWTYPSLASYQSGLGILNHMLFHSKINSELPKNNTMLFEYIKSMGYHTCKMDGDWRSSYLCGYTRGIDQYIYQIQSMGSRAEQEIINAIEHIETFKETDQYMWMCVGDLHDIADRYDLSLAVQSNLTLEERQYVESGETSVKQPYSIQKIECYKKTIQYMDTLFGILYNYIETHYAEDEYMISLFADHGQGYMVPKGSHFLSKERTKVAFMYRGADVEAKVTDEIMSTADYLPIMCKLLGIELKKENIDGILPVAFGGDTEREYAITESLHPGDIYSAVANTKEYEVYFDNGEKTDDEGRFHLKDYKIYGYYRDGSKLEDREILAQYERIFLERIAEKIIYD